MNKREILKRKSRFYKVLSDTTDYKSKIAGIEKEYTEKRDKREARLKERIKVLEEQI